jgi:hypothetical protein
MLVQAGKFPVATVLEPLVVYSAKVPSVAVILILSISFAVYEQYQLSSEAVVPGENVTDTT